MCQRHAVPTSLQSLLMKLTALAMWYRPMATYSCLHISINMCGKEMRFARPAAGLLTVQAQSCLMSAAHQAVV